MAARGRQPGFQMGAEHRRKIANSNILTYLVKHIEGKREMGPTQVTAALGLLKKVMPDLSSLDVAATHDVSDGLKELLKEIDGRTRGIPTAS